MASTTPALSPSAGPLHSDHSRRPDLSPAADSGSVHRSRAMSKEKDYAEAIAAFSSSPDNGFGQYFKLLAEFLSASGASWGGHPVIIYEPSYDYSNGPWSLNRRVVEQCNDFRDLALKRDQTKASLLFLSGCPAPEWLRCIGSEYCLDPEFFRRHLDFTSSPTSLKRTANVILHSSFCHMVSFDVTTIYSESRHHLLEISSERRRRLTNASMRCHREALEEGRFPLGRAVVRDWWTLDATHLAIQQRVALYMHRESDDWTGKQDSTKMRSLYAAQELFQLTEPNQCWY